MAETITLEDERAGDAAAREALLDRAMGPIRFRRSSERLREGRLPADGLALVARDGADVVGTVRLWNARAGGLSDALMLGPLAVDEGYRGRGIAADLMAMALRRATLGGHAAIVLVGDAPYYSRFGFTAHAARRLAMPGPFERHRMLAVALWPGALERAHGTLRAAGRRIDAMTTSTAGANGTGEAATPITGQEKIAVNGR